MKAARKYVVIVRWTYFAILALLPLVAAWLWWEDGMWSNGAMPTHGFLHTVGGCVMALALYGLVRMGDRRK